MIYYATKQTDEQVQISLTSTNGFRYFTFHLNQMSNKLIKAINARFEEEGGPEEAIQLNLSNLQLTTISKDIKKLLEKAKGIEVLVISDNQLTSLDGLPDWKLCSINAGNNKLTDSVISRLAKYPELSELILDNNNIKTLEALSPLFTLKSLMKLDFMDNPVTQLPNYREHLFEKVPSLVVLDGTDRDGNEIQEELEDDEDEDDEEDGEEGEEGSEEEDEDDDEDSQSAPNPKKK